MKSIYIAGPMSGIPEFNFPAFFAAEEMLRSEGYEVFNPANKELERSLDATAYIHGDHIRANATGFNFREAYLWDVTKVIQSDAIYMLRGWEKSPGAVGEHAVAVATQKHHPEYEIIYEQSPVLNRKSEERTDTETRDENTSRVSTYGGL